MKLLMDLQTLDTPLEMLTAGMKRHYTFIISALHNIINVKATRDNTEKEDLEIKLSRDRKYRAM